MAKVNTVVRDYKGRKVILTKTSTSGKENLMLYGHHKGKLEFTYPASANALPELPEPVLGINGATEGVKTKDGYSITSPEQYLDKVNSLPTITIEITKSKAKCQDTWTRHFKQSLQDKFASRVKGLKLDTESHKQDTTPTISAPKSVTISNSDEEKSVVKNVGTSEVSGSETAAEATGEEKQKMKKSTVSDTSKSVGSESVVRVVDNCTDLASDPAVKPVGPKTFSKARRCTR